MLVSVLFICGLNTSLGTKFLTPKKVTKFQRQAFREFYFCPQYILAHLKDLKNPYKISIIFKELGAMLKNYFFSFLA